MNFKFVHIVTITALLLASCAAYYSIYGISQLFGGGNASIILMITILEVSKIVIVSLLQRYWGDFSKTLKTYLVACVIVLMGITSAGIYGFLSSAYQKTSLTLQMENNNIRVHQNKIDNYNSIIEFNNNIINNKNERSNQLINIRQLQESRLDDATTTYSKNLIRNDIRDANRELQTISVEIAELNNKNVSLFDSINQNKTVIATIRSESKISGEIGPLIYISKLLDKDMDVVANYFILLLIFVFDPLAVVLVFSANKLHRLPQRNSINNENEEAQAESNIQIAEETPPTKPKTQKLQESIKNASRFMIERIGSNKLFKDGNKKKLYYKRED